MTSILDQFDEYKELLTDHPNVVTVNLKDAIGNTYRYHRYDSHIFGAILNPKGQFTQLIKDLRLH